MNAIIYALNNLRHSIPEEILRLAFSSQNIGQHGARWGHTQQTSSIDSIIRDKVIEGRVNIDCNLLGGTEVAIDLGCVRQEQYNESTKVFTIPHEMTGGRSIVSIRSLSYMTYNGAATYNYNNSNQLLSAAKDLLHAISNMPIVGTANCQLIGDNVVMVVDNVHYTSDRYALLCLIENDAAMNNLNPGIFPVYSRLVELACKAYIYNHINISMDQGQLNGGMALGRIREIVDSYADSNELYREYFKEMWGVSSFTNDRPRMNNFIKSMVGRGR